MHAKDIPVDGFANPYYSMYEDYLIADRVFSRIYPEGFRNTPQGDGPGMRGNMLPAIDLQNIMIIWAKD